LPKGIFPNDFAIPEIGVTDPQKILDLSISEVRRKNLKKNFSARSNHLKFRKNNNNDDDDDDNEEADVEEKKSDFYTPRNNINDDINENSKDLWLLENYDNLEAAKEVFNDLSRGSSTISLYDLPMVLEQFDLQLSQKDIDDLIEQIGTNVTQDITFAEAVEVATYIVGL
jgi:hypothetical protein